MNRVIAAAVFTVSLAVGLAVGQVQPAATGAGPDKPAKAIGYRVGGGATKVTLMAVGSTSTASGEAKVDAKKGATNVEVEVRGLSQPTRLGAAVLTYVLWAVSPEGSTYNLGEIRINGSGDGKLRTSTQLQAFSLFVTAEPYFSVHRPSEIVVLQNEIRPDTKGEVSVVHEYKLMERAQYEQMGNPLALSVDLKHVPLEMYEARNAAQIARTRGAEKYAPDIYAQVAASLKKAEDALQRKAGDKEVVSAARQAVQFAEDARSLAVQRQEEERIAADRAAAAARAKADAEAKAATEAAAAKARADAEVQRQAEVAAAREAKLKAESEVAAMKAKMEADALAAKAKADADAAAAAAAQAKADADAREAQARAEADALKAKGDAAQAAAEQARKDAEALRAQLLEQFSRILETRDTVRGLVVNMADVLFDTGKFNLKPATREKLARLGGIVLAHPGLNLAIEGHTDSTGSDELNQKLSEQRAGTVRSFLIEQGLPEASLTAQGFGKTMPVADNSTAEGRRQNRRVEIIVSGEIIGTKIGR